MLIKIMEMEEWKIANVDNGWLQTALINDVDVVPLLTW